MEFTFRCPKCRGEDFFIENDRKNFGGIGTDMRVLTCRCGKQLFGKGIDEEHARQAEFYRDMQPKPPNSIATRIREERKRSREAHLALEEKVRKRDAMFAAERAALEKEQEEQKEEEARLRAKKTKQKEPEQVMRCAWPGCPNPRRWTSKYCSRDCSNKNARKLYTDRQKATSSPEPSAEADTCACHEHSPDPSGSRPDPAS